jgi:hypothetical protein
MLCSGGINLFDFNYRLSAGGTNFRSVLELFARFAQGRDVSTTEFSA